MALKTTLGSMLFVVIASMSSMALAQGYGADTNGSMTSPSTTTPASGATSELGSTSSDTSGTDASSGSSAPADVTDATPKKVKKDKSSGATSDVMLPKEK